MTIQPPGITDTDHLHRSAYNAAFYELGLGWHWDAGTFERLAPLPCKAERVRAYLATHQPHLLSAYDAAFLAEAIEATKTRCYDTMLACGGAVAANTDWAALHARQIGA
ncbi:MAG: hypothetical protein NVSMB6_17220 [Burkholderiaceae bacterium]